MTSWPSKRRAVHGFTLIEISLVLVLFALFAGSGLSSLYGWQNQQADQRAALQLDTALEALYGMAISQGRLPCPASPTVDSSQANAGLENCALEHGVLPWRTLGLPETDPWGQRFTYFARNSFTAPLPAEARAAFALDSLGNAYVRPAANASVKDADLLPAVLLSHGRNGLGGYRSNGQRTLASSDDERENSDADLAFVAQRPGPQYDDHVRWISGDVLKSRLLAAGRLP